MLATRPLFVLSIAFMVGIGAVAVWSSLSTPSWIGAGCAIGIVGLILIARGGRVLLAGAILAAGAAGVLRYTGSMRAGFDDISRLAPAPYARVVGFIASDPDVRTGRATFYLTPVMALTAGIAHRVSGLTSVLVSIPHKGAEFDFHDGDRVELIGSLDRTSGLSNSGQDSWAQYLARRGVWCEMHVRRPVSIVLLSGGQPNWFRLAAWRARSALLRSLRSILPRQDAAVLAGVLLGLRTDLPTDLLAAFVATGTIHILATAGLHVGILYKLVLDALTWLTAPRKAAALGTIGALWLYDLMAGGRIAVTRAVIMATIYLVGIVIERSPDILNSLGCAALIVLAFSPGQLLDTGFEASFAAVLMIALMMPVWERYWDPAVEGMRGRWPRLICRRTTELVGLTLFAQAGAAPIIARSFNVVALAGSFANLIVVPILFYLIPAGLVIAIAGIWLPSIAGVLAHWLLAGPIGFIVAVVTWAARVPAASTVIASPSVVQIAAYFTIAVFVLLRSEAWLWRTRVTKKRQTRRQ